LKRTKKYQGKGQEGHDSSIEW